MKFHLIPLALLFTALSCSSPTEDSSSEGSNSNVNNTEQEAGSLKDEGTPVPDNPEFAAHEFMDVEFGSNPFTTTNPRYDVFQTAFLKLDTVILANRTNASLKDTIYHFLYDDSSEISLFCGGDGRVFIAFAGLASNILPLKNNIALGMDKPSFWKSFEQLEGVESRFNIIRVTNEDKLKWVGVQFINGIFQVMEYRGNVDE